MFNKKCGLVLLTLLLLLVSVSSVCATEPDNSTNEKISIDDSNGFNSDIIHSLTKKIIQNDPDVKELKNTNKILNDKVNNQSIEIKHLKEENKELKNEIKQLKKENIKKDIKINNQSIEIKQLKKENKQLYKITDGLNIRVNSLEIKNSGLSALIKSQGETIKSQGERISFLEKEVKEVNNNFKEINRCMFKIQENYEKLLNCTISPVEKENLKNEIKELKSKINSINKELENLKISPPPNK